MVNQKQHKQYLHTQIKTATREQLVLMLYDGAIRFAEQGKIAISEGKYEEAHNLLMRSQAIIMELIYGLDKEQGGEIAENMAKLYSYSFQRLVEANMNHKLEPVEEMQKIFKGLREAWNEAMNQNPGTPQNAPLPAQQAERAVKEPPVQQQPTGGLTDIQAKKATSYSAKAKPKFSHVAPLAEGLRPRLSVQG